MLKQISHRAKMGAMGLNSSLSTTAYNEKLIKDTYDEISNYDTELYDKFRAARSKKRAEYYNDGLDAIGTKTIK